MSVGDTTRVRVMLVEDSLVVRTLLAHIVGRDPRLELALAVESGEQALAAIASVSPDVISMDIRLPGIDGLETTRRIMADHPTPIGRLASSPGAPTFSRSRRPPAVRRPWPR